MMFEATLSERRKRVTNRSIEGKVDNSSASFEERVIIRIATEREMLHASSTSSRGVGSRINSVARTTISPAAIMMLLCLIHG